MTAPATRAETGATVLSRKDYAAPSVFTPQALLREARRQKGMVEAKVPATCILDPDGDIVRSLVATGRARPSPTWACYHTTLHLFEEEGKSYGIVGCVVGAPFAVLVAEELFACGCELLISMTSAGQILPIRPPPYFIIIDRALRDEGTSGHYLAPSAFSAADAPLVRIAANALASGGEAIEVGATWTTDAPFRETEDAVAAARDAGILAVEMEAAALYAFAIARKARVLCFAHVTNQMGRVEGDFEKGVADGAEESLRVITKAARALRE